MPNLAPNILRADTAPPIGTSINACYGSDIIQTKKNRWILTYGFHSKFLGNFEIPVCSVNRGKMRVPSDFDQGKTS